MKILSLFDGMACWYEALVRAWIKVDKYYASEIDKYAIQIATKNHPDIIEIWDVCEIKWEDYQDIDLLIWGSPCQWFSVAGKMLNFNDPRSKLFFEYVRLLRQIKPKYFLLENVKMKKERQDIISRELWVEPIEINSSLVSAQNRRRLYRTNIPNISQPTDKGILLKDILEENVDGWYYLTDNEIDMISKWKGFEKPLENIKTLVSVVDWEVRVKQATKQWYIVANDGDGISLASNDSTSPSSWWWISKANTITTQWESHVVLIPQTVRVRKYEVDIEWLKAELKQNKKLTNKEIAERLDQPITKVEHRFRNDNCFAIPDPEIRFKLKELLWITTDRFDKSITEFEEKQWTYEKWERKILPSWKMTTLTASQNDDVIAYPRIRKLTPIECERLQTLPDNYTSWVSDSQRYKMLGNWWTVDVIAHIFRFILSSDK
jgi:site-specific DNA-cytosine methylase